MKEGGTTASQEVHRELWGTNLNNQQWTIDRSGKIEMVWPAWIWAQVFLSSSHRTRSTWHELGLPPMPWPGPPVQVARTLPPSSWTGCFAQQTCFGTWGCCRPKLASLSSLHPQDTWCSVQPPPLMLWTLSMVNVWYKLSTGILSLPGYEGGWCGGPLREGLIVNFPRHPPPCWKKMYEVEWGWIYNNYIIHICWLT